MNLNIEYIGIIVFHIGVFTFFGKLLHNFDEFVFCGKFKLNEVLRIDFQIINRLK